MYLIIIAVGMHTKLMYSFSYYLALENCNIALHDIIKKVLGTQMQNVNLQNYTIMSVLCSQIKYVCLIFPSTLGQYYTYPLYQVNNFYLRWWFWSERYL